jgi:hypothetical protein
MTVEQKMTNVIQSVLGKEYTVKITETNNYRVEAFGEFVLSNGSSNDLNSHWRELIATSIGIIIDLKIVKALNEN